MQILSNKDTDRKKVVAKLTSQVTVRKDNEITSRPRIYKRTSDASEFVRKIVEANKIPVDKSGEKLTRTDLSRTSKQGVVV